MKYMRLFDQHSEYETYISSETADLPNVSWCINERESHINPKDYSKEYLTFNILSGGTINWKASNTGITRTISYSKDSGETWTDITSSTAGASFNVSAGETVMFKGTNSAYATSVLAYDSFSGSTAYLDIEGNIMSLIAGDNFETATTLSASYTFYRLFGFAKIVNARHLILPATTLSERCYYNMFVSCGLTTAPELPATTLANGCYSYMFQNCTSLTRAPELPATTLADGCYNGMFSSCRGLTTAPELPATTLARNCYYNMFYGCARLTTSSELPATTLANNCYNSMFYGCSSLTTAPELPSTTLVNECYCNMFEGCGSLTAAPELPATTLADGCYSSMFNNCTSLITAPSVLPATTLANYCYYSMFYMCHSLSDGPKIYAENGNEGNQFYDMFQNCGRLSSLYFLGRNVQTNLIKQLGNNIGIEIQEKKLVVNDLNLYENCDFQNQFKPMFGGSVSESYWMGYTIDGDTEYLIGKVVGCDDGGDYYYDDTCSCGCSC